MRKLSPYLLFFILLMCSCGKIDRAEFESHFRTGVEAFAGGDDEKAMDAFIAAEACCPEDMSSVELGVMHVYKGDIYSRVYDYENAVESYRQGADMLLSCGDTAKYHRAVTMICEAYIQSGDSEQASKYMDILASAASQLGKKELQLYKMLKIKLADPSEIDSLIEDYLMYFTDPADVEWRILAHYQLLAGNTDDAFEAIKKEAEYRDVSSDQNYFAVLSEVKKQQGDFKAALAALERSYQIDDSLEVAAASSNLRFAEDLHKDRQEYAMELSIRNIYLLGILTILVFLVFAFRETHKRLLSATEEKVRMQIEKERVEKLYSDALIERDALSKMAEATAPNPEMKLVIKERLALLNKVIASYITDSSSANKEANAQIEMLVSNREAFLESTRKSFEAGHPRFMAYLRSCGLSDWEVNYCCLYLVGLNGKEIGEYINLKRHYTYGSVIRQKLGLGEHDRNLANHLKNMLENPPA